MATSDQELHHVPPKGLLAWIVDAAKEADDALQKSAFANDTEFAWVTELATTEGSMFDPGNPLAADRHQQGDTHQEVRRSNP